MEIPIFRESIAESASILSTEGVDLLQILDPLNNEINTSIRSAMIAITSVQVKSRGVAYKVVFRLTVSFDFACRLDW